MPSPPALVLSRKTKMSVLHECEEGEENEEEKKKEKRIVYKRGEGKRPYTSATMSLRSEILEEPSSRM
ncbi:hypothetical protein EYF80_052344 [Liparis tanakae]|uniref:Uncharacterized protein n=1 Tax=Liparis tanakae TaxID=230148 RepID=A0A4Z2F9D0_9TELE|nr:hypothetical protein EYF80_052344 [Liparis tanakae]